MCYVNFCLEKTWIPNPSTFHHFPSHLQWLSCLTMRNSHQRPCQVRWKTMLIDIEVVNAQLDYNLLLGHNYMYEM